jgi:hypothetical protein
MRRQSLARRVLTCKQVSGQSLTEVALVLPLLVLLLMGLVEFGFLLYAHNQVANAAREAARAASLYRSTRYAFADTNTKCDGTINGWSLQNVVDQAVVYRSPLDNQGCRDINAPVASTSLGWLNPTPAAPDQIQITIRDVEDTNFWTTSTQKSGDVMPSAGTRATVRLSYPYRLVVVSNLLPFLKNPIAITKSVKFEFTQ